jgi:hypothetical protein
LITRDGGCHTRTSPMLSTTILTWRHWSTAILLGTSHTVFFQTRTLKSINRLRTSKYLIQLGQRRLTSSRFGHKRAIYKKKANLGGRSLDVRVSLHRLQ